MGIPSDAPPSYKSEDYQECLKEESKKHSGLSRVWSSYIRPNIFLIFLLVGIVSGIIMGIGIRASHPAYGEDKRNLMYLGFPGQLLLRMLKCCIIPLIVSSLIAGMASIPVSSAGRLGGLTVLYYMLTTLLAVIVGIILVTTIKPGEKADQFSGTSEERIAKPVDSFLDLIRYLNFLTSL